MVASRLKQLWTLLIDDGRIAFRRLLNGKGVASAVVFSLSVGVGANVAAVSVLDRILFQSPPGVQDPDNIRRLYMQGRIAGEPMLLNVFSRPALDDIANAVARQAHVAGYELLNERPLDQDRALVTIAFVSRDYFNLLGITPQYGRFFNHDDMAAPEYDPVILSHGVWVRAYGRDSAIIGRSVSVDGMPAIVVGVAPERFEGVDLDVVGAWLPLASRRSGSEGSRYDRGTLGNLQVLIRARDQHALRLDQELTEGFLRHSRIPLQLSDDTRVITAPLLQARGPALPGNSWHSLTVAKLLAVIGVVVLIAALVNVAGLLLMATMRRRRETAVQLSLGAPRWRLMVQTGMESAALAVVATIVATAGGWMVGKVLRSALVVNERWSATPHASRLMVLSAVLAFCGIVIATTVPAYVASQSKALDVLRLRGADRTGSRARLVLLFVETAASLILLSVGSAGIQALRQASAMDAGVDVDRLVTVDLSGRRVSAAALDRATERMRGLPEVDVIARASWDIRPYYRNSNIAVRGGAKVNNDSITHPALWVDSTYFRAAGLSMVDGRGVDGSDVFGSELVIVLSETMARRYWPSGRAVGSCLTAMIRSAEFSPLPAGQLTCLRVVGVFKDLRWDPKAPPTQYAYLSLHQVGPQTYCCHNMLVRLRERASPDVVGAIASIITSEFPPGVAPPRIRAVRDRLDPLRRPAQVAALMLGLFGLLAVVSTAIGIYGLVSYDLAQRSHELAVRKVVGARYLDLVGTVLSSTLGAVCLGAVVGLIAVVWSRPVIARAMLDSSSDATIIFAAALATILTATVAAIIGIRGINRIEPATVLRGGY